MYVVHRVQPVDFFTDYFVPNLDPYEYRIQLSARTGGQNANMDIDKLEVVQTGGIGGALRLVEDVSGHLDDLQNGQQCAWPFKRVNLYGRNR